jgi:hypothetical protein
MDSTRIEPGRSHENRVAEKRHDVLKTALEQALVRGSREFASAEQYAAFVAEVTARLNARERVVERPAEERPHLLPLPAKPFPAYTTYRPVVRKWSTTIRVGKRTYSVPSRLIGHEVEARLPPDIVDVCYNDTNVETMPRLRGPASCRTARRMCSGSTRGRPSLTRRTCSTRAFVAPSSSSAAATCTGAATS